MFKFLVVLASLIVIACGVEVEKSKGKNLVPRYNPYNDYPTIITCLQKSYNSYDRETVIIRLNMDTFFVEKYYRCGNEMCEDMTSDILKNGAMFNLHPDGRGVDIFLNSGGEIVLENMTEVICP